MKTKEKQQQPAPKPKRVLEDDKFVSHGNTFEFIPPKKKEKK